MKSEVSDIEVEKAYRRAAKIVAMYGEKYLPVFERLEKEFRKRQKKAALMRKAFEVAMASSD